MRHRSSRERRCSYLVVLESSRSSDELRELAAYLSEIAVLNFEVIVVDASADLDEHRRVFRWVSRYVAARPQHFSASGRVDLVRTAVDLAVCDKVIVADDRVRYSCEALDDLCALLDVHEVVEPQDYLDPMPWWVSPQPRRSPTFGLRRRAIRGLRSIDTNANARDAVRRLASQGAEVFNAMRVFVRRVPPAFSDWIADLPRRAEEELAMPANAALLLMLVPAIIAVALIGGARIAAATVAASAFLSIVFAAHDGVAPWRACFFAPLWMLQRSLSVYAALLWRVRRTAEPRRVPVPVTYQSPSESRAAD